ncbi:hypothetical protein SLA2020_270560 [Shorea laevis]
MLVSGTFTPTEYESSSSMLCRLPLLPDFRKTLPLYCTTHIRLSWLAEDREVLVPRPSHLVTFLEAYMSRTKRIRDE